jgi:O-antigen/teichoic acid export membrane protein
VSSLGLIATNGLWAIGRPRAGLPADGCMLLSTIVLAWRLIALYGAFGAALAALLGTCIGTFLKIFALYRALALCREPLEAASSCHEFDACSGG